MPRFAGCRSFLAIIQPTPELLRQITHRRPGVGARELAAALPTLSPSIRNLLRRVSRFLAAAAIGMAVGGAAAAPTPMITDYVADAFFTNDGFTLGYVITFSSTVDVLTLGYVDVDGDLTPLGQDHDVGLWDLFGNLLASATISTADPFRMGYRYAALASPLSLVAGQYVIGGFTGTDLEPVSTSASGATTSAGVAITPADGLFPPCFACSFNNGLFSTSGNLDFPGSAYGEFNWVANLEYDLPSRNVPEPSTLALLFLGIAALMLRPSGWRVPV